MKEGTRCKPVFGDELSFGLVRRATSSTSMNEWVAPTEALRFRFEFLGWPNGTEPLETGNLLCLRLRVPLGVSSIATAAGLASTGLASGLT